MSFVRAQLCGCGMLLCGQLLAATPSQVPLSVRASVSPNLIVTLDDNLNMGYSHSPEGQYSHNPDYNLMSPDSNRLFYDPKVNYVPPPYFAMENGKLVKHYYPNMDFTKAYSDGYAYKERKSYTSVGPYDFSKTVPRGWDESSFQTWDSSETIISTTPNGDIIPGRYHYYRWHPERDARCGPPGGPAAYAAPITDQLNINGGTGGLAGALCYQGYYIPGAFTAGEEPSDASLLDPDCDAGTSSQENQCANNTRQNYANWFGYYSTRISRAKTILSFLMADLPEDVRVTWQSTVGCFSPQFNSASNAAPFYSRRGGDNCQGVSQRLAPMTGQHKADFYTFLKGTMKTDLDNPTRPAVHRVNEYLKVKGANSPYREVVGDASSPEYSCRPTVHLIVTHGRYGERESDGLYQSFWDHVKNNTTNQDSQARTLPDGTQYTPRAPYRDTLPNRLSDLVFEGWANDARPDLENLVPPSYREGTDYWSPRNDPSTWQNVSTYIVSMGTKRKSYAYGLNWAGDTYGGSYAQLASGTLGWPDNGNRCASWNGPAGAGENACGLGSYAQSNLRTDQLSPTPPDKLKGSDFDDWGTASTITDMWHSALNGRGRLYDMESSRVWEVVKRDILPGDAVLVSSGTLPLVAEKRVADGSGLYYQAGYIAGKWQGTLKQFRMDAQGNKSEVVDFAGKLTSALTDGGAKRSLYVNRGTDSGGGPSLRGKLVSLDWSQLSAEQRSDLAAPIAGHDELTEQQVAGKRIAWVKGDTADEGTLFRQRPEGRLLGDIVNSLPVVVPGKPDGNPYYMNKRGVEYADFVTRNASREARVYAASNDGMVHAFDQSGEEKWAFIPASSIKDLHLLSAPEYTSSSAETRTSSRHRYFVDGPLVTEDVYFDGAWHSILVGSPGRGGKGIFALDVTDPDKPALLWEYGDFNASLQTEGARPGYILSRPVVVQLRSGSADISPYVVFGNGYGGQGQGSIMAVDLATGALSASISTDEVADGSSQDLGAGGIVGLLAETQDLVRVQQNRFYAGTLAGEVLVGNPVEYDDDEAGRTVFTALPSQRRFSGQAAPQAITAAPELARITTVNGALDVLMLGTGKFFEDTDSTRVLLPSNLNTIYGLSTDSDSPALDRLNALTLKEQSLNGGNVLNIEGAATDWASQDGFYLDLPEKNLVLDQPILAGQVVLTTVTSLVSDDPCNPKTVYWVLAIDPRTGKKPPFRVFDTNGDGVIDGADADVAGIQFPEKPLITPNRLTTSGGQVLIQTLAPERTRFNQRVLTEDSFYKGDK